MIIFGTRGVTYSAGSGDFYCPGCQAHQPYKQKRVRRFFTLYFIPVIPLDLAGEYVECSGCGGTYKTEVLQLDPQAGAAAFAATFHSTLVRVMVEMARARGPLDEPARQTIRHIWDQVVDPGISEEQLRSLIDQATVDQEPLEDTLTRMGDSLSDKGKELVVKAAVLVGAAGGHFHEQQQTLVATIGESLGMSTAHVKGVIAESLQEG
jgi:uncharacterized membrane protein YebE (DUF533 family)